MTIKELSETISMCLSIFRSWGTTFCYISFGVKEPVGGHLLPMYKKENPFMGLAGPIKRGATVYWNKSQYWPHDAKKHVDTAKNYKA